MKAHHHIYIHNDIGNAAFYFKNRVDERIAKGDRDGVGLEIMAGLTLLAFEVEARFNFLGAKLMADWNERAPAIEKVERVGAHLGVAPDFSLRPYFSIAKLKDFRDTLAHGKPEDKIFDEEVVATAEELEEMGVFCTPSGSPTSSRAFSTRPIVTLSRSGKNCSRNQGWLYSIR